MRPTVSFLFALVLFASTAVVGNAFVLPASSSVSSSSSWCGRPVIGCGPYHDKAVIFLQKDDDNDDKEQTKPSMTKGTRPSITPMFDNFNRAIWAFGILFIVSSFILESFGYSYVVVDNHLEINTLDYRQFQDEVVKAAKEAKRLSNSI